MREGFTARENRQFSPPSTFRLVAVQITCLSAAGIIAVGALIASIVQVFGRGVTADWIGMTLDPLIASVGCGASLAFSIARPSKSHDAAGRILACVAAVSAFLDLLSRFHDTPQSFETFINGGPVHAPAGAMPSFVAVAFVLLAVLLCVIRISRGLASIVADCIAVLLGLLVLATAFGWVFSVARVFETTYVDRTPPATLCILALLILVAASVRAQYGAFDIFVGTGIGSRIARALAPALLVLPFVRETTRARVIRLHFLPEHSEAAILAAMASMISLGFLIMIARHIRRMEQEIHRLSLRDELTGLHNLRGFRLLAEQALRLAVRSQMPFSVLFVDLDGLKEINDSLGHGIGSAFLVETAGLLNATFRETDVVARIGGDEFAVAGQFSRTGIAVAGHRLQDQASRTAVEASAGRPLSLSLGAATKDETQPASLQDLLDEADLAMYEDKRRKKMQAFRAENSTVQA
jgi:diguanylate cyclase (GGDEF)-like protein